jgi:8-oxo-dGTP diphosphatase
MLSPGVGCGAAILRDGKLLLIRRARPPEAGCWSLPGGKVDLYEMVESTVRREIAEEVGITLGALSLLCVVDLIVPDEAAHWVSPTYLVHDFTGEPVNLEPEKHSGLGWFGLDDLPSPLAEVVTVAVAALRART